MKKILFVFVLVFYLFGLNAQIDETLSNELQGILNNSVSTQGNNGVSAYLIMPNGETWSGTAGVGKQNIQISDTTLFHGASTTKFNIALLMLLLVEENLIDLDEPWVNYLDFELEFDNTITIRQLLNHTSGIADYLETSSSGNDIISDFEHFYTPLFILENIISSVPSFPAGTNFDYSNSNYLLAALIIEAVTGNSVHLELRNRIWQPLNMNHTYFGAYENYDEPLAGVWWNFDGSLKDYSDEATTSMLSYAFGAGNIVSTPTDLSNLLHGVLNGILLNNESMQELSTFVPESFNSWTAGYGLGIHHQSNQNDDIVLGHDGYYTNMTDMFHSNSYSFTLTTMTNTQTNWFGIFNPMYDLLVDYFITSDIQAPKIKNSLKIHPNPTNEQIYLSSDQLIKEIQLQTILGNEISRLELNSKQYTLHIRNEGLYIITIKTKNNSSSRKIQVIR